MRKIVEVKPLPDKKLFVKYSDSLEGILNLVKLSERDEYKALREIDKFQDAYVHPETGDIIINSNIELCKNATYDILNLKKQMEALGLFID
ncbi:MAG: DUF2442 domain-containing protein [Chlorobi bacterium]|nr:DUF2442 domain-containing protein [Chlorobiota bacterium]